MSSLWIVNEDRSIRAEIVPAHGGMVAQIELEGKELLHIDRGQLETAPMAAGGMPILFPFPSKTKDDAYQFKGKQYHMPMHGLVKNDVFAVGETGENRARLWLENSPSWKAQYYPFDFRLEVEYRLEKNSLTVLFGIENRGDEAMPHYLGWHPFFKSTDKKRIRLWQDMRVHYDYVRQVDEPGIVLDDLSRRWDDVFHTPEKGGFILENEADGYRVSCEADREFEALVVCSWVEESMCVEPWCGLPDSINTGRFVRWIDPGKKKEYRVCLTFENLK